MIVSTIIKGSLEVTDEALAHSQVPLMEAIRTRLSRMVVAEGEKIGAFINPTSVVFYDKKASDFSRIVTVYWCPDPTLGVELRGGPKDGDVVPLPRMPDQMPPSEVTFPDEQPDYGGNPFLPQSDRIEDLVMRNPVYVRFGKNTATDRWVYDHRP